MSEVPSIRKGYSDGPHGQLHWRLAPAKAEANRPDLYCLHPAPFSGLAFTQIMPYLVQNRRVIAPDFPGHGGSHDFHATPSIADYAEAMMAVVANVSDDPVDILGFHSGCLVATEMALIEAAKVNRLALVDIPAFTEAERRKYLSQLATPLELTPQLYCLAPAWERGITRRIDSQGMDRSFAMFVEQLRHGREMNAAFHASFTYAIESRLPLLRHHVGVIATRSSLLEATRRAADMLPHAQLIERLDIKRAVLDEAGQSIAKDVLSFLDADQR
ncbi:alpha/beta fold hydrolase [Alterisphingorhabdus coralli]|uniref:Alpha/beta fold hydrolase n=1 Tax=Alterisphingorhabdus coralli TaxID=3071408 RepID=A0AA97I0V2_9SPHN|nr:alpha/beta fold hydrolase [Parasphingorhabdus sp. SCSIO 66989]WOE75392.1 alpha/beta fold hydrolase [Parasphingorhabdus sp. SCSIO 66989]